MELVTRYQNLLKPSEALIADLAKLSGDIMILGAGGKMGPALARLTQQGIAQAGIKKRIIAVARFSSSGLEKELQQQGIETIQADLLEDDQLNALPEAENVLYLAGMKFGTSGNEPLTWAMNSYLPGRVAEKFKKSRIVVFSTGNVYPLTKIDSGGPTENHSLGPLGEYAQSCLGRERMFQYFSAKNNTPALIYRLNYANDVSYGVLVDLAKAVQGKKPIDLSMGYVNVIWQGDANEIALRCLLHCSIPPKVLNVTGLELVQVRNVAERFGVLFGEKPMFVNQEKDTALLSNASESVRLFGKPNVSLNIMMELIADWLKAGGKLLNKPTHFQEREGKF